LCRQFVLRQLAVYRTITGGEVKNEEVIYAPTDATAVTSPEHGMHRQVLAYNQKVMLVRHQFSKGWEGQAHSHPHEQLVYVVTGRIQFHGGGKTLDLRAGDSLIVAGDVEHQASALEDSEVLDVFTPYRSDYAQ
jgi:quercetin dioxygenase-like cupin family protein